MTLLLVYHRTTNWGKKSASKLSVRFIGITDYAHSQLGDVVLKGPNLP